MEAKIAKFLKFFKFFGIFYDDLNNDHPPIKSLNLFRARISGIFWCSMFVVFILHSTYLGITQNLFSDFEYLMQFMVCFYVQIAGFSILLFSYKNRKKEEAILKDLSEINELIEKYLDIKGDLGKFKRRAAWKIALQLLFVLNIAIFRFSFESEIYLHQIHQLPIPEIAVVTCVLYFTKNIFYVDLLHFQMKVRIIFINFLNFKLI